MTLLTVLLLTLVSTVFSGCFAQPGDNKSTKERASRAPQSQIRYNDPEGSKVNWKLYAPHNQWRSHLASKRLQRAEASQPDYTATQSTVVQGPLQHQPQYQPYSAVPDHIKRLITEAYSHEGPYVDPGAFFYQAFAPITVSSLANQESDNFGRQQSYKLERGPITRASGYQAIDSHSNGKIDGIVPKAGIKYQDDERLTERSAILPYGAVIASQSRDKIQYQPYKKIDQSQQPQTSEIQKQFRKQSSEVQRSSGRYNAPNSPIVSQTQTQTDKQPNLGQRYNKQMAESRLQQLDSNKQQRIADQPYHGNFMPMAIQRLLTYQAQLPYNVIANQIIFRPKQPFIPKPLPESAKLSKQYPSKVYFLKSDGQVYESPELIKNTNDNEKRF